MKSLQPLVSGVVADLRNRGLLPVAIALLVALVAVPVLLRDSAEAPVSTAASAPAVAVTPNGLPAPDEALDERPLVTMATLRSPSKLESFDSRNPFQPLRGLEEIAADGDAPSTATTDISGDLAAASPGSDSPSSGGSPSPGTPDSPDPFGGDPVPDPAPTPTPSPTPEPPSEERLTYAVDLTFDTPGGLARRYRNVQRLQMLPSELNPLLIFLGVDVTGNRATFLVDATLRAQAGGGNCSPSTAECATLTLEPGEQRTFVDEQDQAYLLRLDQIREVPVASATVQLGELADLSTDSEGPAEPVRRFVMPSLSDVLVIGGQQ